jgi:hypothetical protein
VHRFRTVPKFGFRGEIESDRLSSPRELRIHPFLSQSPRLRSRVSINSKKSARAKDYLPSIRLDMALVAEEISVGRCGDSPCSAADSPRQSRDYSVAIMSYFEWRSVLAFIMRVISVNSWSIGAP